MVSSNGNALEKVSEGWKPLRSVASWYLWQHIDGRCIEVVADMNAALDGDVDGSRPAWVWWLTSSSESR